jgi:hypothetical protein
VLAKPYKKKAIVSLYFRVTHQQDSTRRGASEYVRESVGPPSVLHAKRHSSRPPWRCHPRCCLRIQSPDSATSSRPWRFPRLNRCPQSCRPAGVGRKGSVLHLRRENETIRILRSPHRGNIPDSWRGSGSHAKMLFGSWPGRFRIKSDVGAQTGLDSACDQVRVPLSYVPLDVTALQVAPSSIAYCILQP